MFKSALQKPQTITQIISGIEIIALFFKDNFFPQYSHLKINIIDRQLLKRFQCDYLYTDLFKKDREYFKSISELYFHIEEIFIESKNELIDISNIKQQILKIGYKSPKNLEQISFINFNLKIIDFDLLDNVINDTLKINKSIDSIDQNIQFMKKYIKLEVDQRKKSVKTVLQSVDKKLQKEEFQREMKKIKDQMDQMKKDIKDNNQALIGKINSNHKLVKDKFILNQNQHNLQKQRINRAFQSIDKQISQFEKKEEKNYKDINKNFLKQLKDSLKEQDDKITKIEKQLSNFKIKEDDDYKSISEKFEKQLKYNIILIEKCQTNLNKYLTLIKQQLQNKIKKLDNQKQDKTTIKTLLEAIQKLEKVQKQIIADIGKLKTDKQDKTNIKKIQQDLQQFKTKQINEIFQNLIKKNNQQFQKLLNNVIQNFQSKINAMEFIHKILTSILNQQIKQVGEKHNSLCNTVNQLQQFNKHRFMDLEKVLKAFLVQQLKKRLLGIDLFCKSQIIETKQDEMLLKKWIYETANDRNKNIKINLLYRASENQFSAQKFHQKCDNVNHTLTIIKNQYDKVIGGYTPLSWKVENEQEMNTKQDKSNKSFIFSLNLKQKYKCCQSSKSIKCYKDCGPVFGDGADIRVYNKCNQNNNSYSNFPISYKIEKIQYKSKQQIAKQFTGNQQNNRYLIKQYQVYSIEGL